MKRQFIAIWTFCLVAVSSIASAAGCPYSDVPDNHWAANAVALLAQSGYPAGYSDNTFRGDRNITRYELADMMAELLREKTGMDVSGYANPFSDLASGHRFYDSVTALAAKGIVEGFSDGTFRGDEEITRYEMARDMARLLASANALGGSRINGNPFMDVPSDHWAYNSLIALASKGIIEAYGDAYFNGDRNATRYEAAEMVAKAAVAD